MELTAEASDHMPEIITAFQEEDHFFALVACTKEETRKSIQFGITAKSHECLQRLFELRPFEKATAKKHRYFYSATVGKVSPEEAKAYIRVEGSEGSKQVPITMPLDLVANLQFIFEAETWNKLSHLVVAQC